MKKILIFFLIILSLPTYSKKKITTKRLQLESKNKNLSKDVKKDIVKIDKSDIKNVVTEKSKIDEKDGCSNRICYIPAGDFMMGCNDLVDGECKSDEKPYHKVCLSAYWMDQYEVTVKDFKKCVDAGGCSSKHYNVKDDNINRYCNYGNSGKDDHPMNCVNWYGADQYCRWIGKRLPTEAEWEKAARGTDGRVYPWGDERVSCEYVVMDQSFQIMGGEGCGEGSTWSVNSKKAGKSPYGIYNMVGNVWEWVNDSYDQNYYKKSLIKNPKGGKKGDFRVLRGGSWGYDRVTHFRTSTRGFSTIFYKSPYYGFRCAKSEE